MNNANIFGSTEHTRPVRTRTPPPPRTWNDTLINGRVAEPFELEVRERAYQAELARDTQLVRVAPRGVADGDMTAEVSR